MTPYLSKDARVNPLEYENLCNSFEEVFSWIEAKVCDCAYVYIIILTFPVS